MKLSVFTFNKNKINLELLLALFLFLPSFYYSIANLFISITFIYMVVFALSVYVYISFLVIKPTKFLLFITFFVFITIYSVSNNNNLFNYIVSTNSINDFFTSKLILFIFLYFPVFILNNYRPMNYKLFTKYMYFFSCILLPLNIIINYRRIISVELLDYMAIAYEIVFWLIFFVIGTVARHKKINILLIIPALVSVVIGSSRGALIVLLIFLLLTGVYLVFIEKKYLLKKASIFIYFIIGSLVISSLLILLLNNISNINQFFSDLGISSRIFLSFQDSNFIFDSGRLEIFKEIISYLPDKIFGYGIFMDRLLITSNQYTHNVFLEILINYGLLIGFILISIIFYFTFKAVRISYLLKNTTLIFLVIYSVIYIYIKFMISGSYLQSSEFFLAVGILLNISNTKLRREIND